MALTKIKTSGIADNAITNAKMADDAIDSADFADASIDNVHVATGLDAVKLADGTVTNTEFQYINTLSSNAQTQISAKSPTAGNASLVTTGALASGSIASGFGTIDTGSSTITTTGAVSTGALTVSAGMVDIGSSRDTYVDSSEDDTATAHIFVTGAGVGDFDQLAGSLVIQPRIHGTVYRDIIFAGGLTNASPLMTILGEGNVGIGTDSPANKLHVSDAGQNTVMRIGNNGNYDQYIYFNGGNDWCVGMDYSDSNKFKISGHSSFAGIDDFLTIDTSGNVLIGKTATNIATDGVQFGGGANNAITETADTVLYINRKTNDGELIIFRKDNSTIGSVNSRGGEFIAIGYSDTYLEFNAGSNQINPSSGTAARDNLISLGSSGARFDDAFITNGVTTGSDERMKDEIVDSPIGLSFINDLRPVQYKWKDYDDKTFSRKHYGLIAQEVEQVLTDNGMVNNDFAPLIYDEESDRYGMRYSEYVGILIKAIQELSAKVEALENA